MTARLGEEALHRSKTMKSQMEMWREAERRSGALNRVFMELVHHPSNPLTNEDLQNLIKMRPEVYGRFSGYIGKLADKGSAPANGMRVRGTYQVGNGQANKEIRTWK